MAVTGKLVTSTRPGLTEEYSVSVDGVRQDFIVATRPVGTGYLHVELGFTDARAEAAADGARLTLDGSACVLAKKGEAAAAPSPGVKNILKNF